MPTDTGPMRRIEVVAYRRDWPATFTRFVAELLPVVGPALVGIEHIGSTSVPGLVAKPVIDILLLADPLGALDARDAQFAAIDLEPRGEYGIPGRRFFVRGGPNDRTHHVHAFAPGAPEAQRHLDLRDYLRAHPDTAADYGRLKQRLAAAHPDDIDAYMDGKHAFIRSLLRQAADWRREQAEFGSD